MKNMSFSMTTPQARRREKDITRRLGWWNVKPGERIQQVEKAMGLKKGEKMVNIHVIEVISARREPLHHITLEDVIREGFLGWSTHDFIDLLCDKNKIKPETIVNRIEFRYIT